MNSTNEHTRYAIHVNAELLDSYTRAAVVLENILTKNLSFTWSKTFKSSLLYPFSKVTNLFICTDTFFFVCEREKGEWFYTNMILISLEVLLVVPRVYRGCALARP